MLLALSLSLSQLIPTTKLNEKKKRKVNHDQSSLIQLFKQTVDQGEGLTSKFKQQLHIQLLDLLKQCKHWKRFQKYRPGFEELLQQSEQHLAIQEKKQLMKLIIQYIDYETITHEQSLCFESLVQIFQRSMKKSRAATKIDMMSLNLQQVCLSRRSNR